MAMLTKSGLITAAMLIGVAFLAMAAQAQTVSDGAVIEQDGWRFVNEKWDNTCFLTLDYSDSNACSPSNGN
jgi:hypothetical protein